jgi:hypothetical protein
MLRRIAAARLKKYFIKRKDRQSISIPKTSASACLSDGLFLQSSFFTSEVKDTLTPIFLYKLPQC